VLQKEQEERKDAEAIVSGLKRNLAMAKEKSASIDVEIQQYASNIRSLQNEKMRDRAVLENYAKQTGPALSALEDRLKLRIEGVKRELLHL
jgi:predicted helicase